MTLSMFTKLAAAALAALAALTVLTAAPASATSATCMYQRYYERSACRGVQPTITYRQGCAEERRNQPATWRRDKFCHSLAGYRVKRGDTLWHIAKVWCGRGQDWRIIARANHVHGTLIYTGQRLRLTCVSR